MAGGRWLAEAAAGGGRSARPRRLEKGEGRLARHELHRLLGRLEGPRQVGVDHRVKGHRQRAVARQRRRVLRQVVAVIVVRTALVRAHGATVAGGLTKDAVERHGGVRQAHRPDGNREESRAERRVVAPEAALRGAPRVRAAGAWAAAAAAACSTSAADRQRRRSALGVAGAGSRR